MSDELTENAGDTAVPPSGSPEDSRLNDVLQGLASLNAMVKSQQEQQQYLQQQMLSMQQGVNAPAAPVEKEINEFDLESMSRPELLKVIEERMTSAIAPRFQEMQSQIQNLHSGVTRQSQSSSIEKARSSYPDFDKWRQEMIDLSKENSSLNVDQLYKLVRANDPDKAKQLDEQNTPKEEIEPSKPEGKLTFGGFRPTSAPAESEPNLKLNSDDAAEAAWQELSGELGEFFD